MPTTTLHAAVSHRTRVLPHLLGQAHAEAAVPAKEPPRLHMQMCVLCAREEPFSIHGHLLNISVFGHITMHPIQQCPRVKKSACDRAIGAPCTLSLGAIRWLPSPSNRTSIAIAASPVLKVTSLFFAFFSVGAGHHTIHTLSLSLSVSVSKHTRKMETEM